MTRTMAKRIILSIAVLAAIGIIIAVIFALDGGRPALNPDMGVVVDPGHGGFDPGALAPTTGAYESDINLAMAFALRDELTSRGIPVKMTRADANALGDNKEADMARRRSITNESGAALFVSIHMNSFPSDTSVHGPQVFYKQNSATGKRLADCIQVFANEASGGSRPIRHDGDKNLYVLKEAPMPAVLVECGFLTNPEEEARLQDRGYQKLLAAAIADGIEAYLSGK